MSLEFSVIKQFFQRPCDDKNVVVPSGDDCAIVQIPAGYQLALSIDTLVLGTHFTSSSLPFDLGYKAVTSCISDLAAMGAEPRWLTGSVTLPRMDESWLKVFSDGLFAALERYKISLIGGDLTRGPLSITTQAHGILPAGRAIKRLGACVDDLIYVTNTLGAASYGVQLTKGNIALNRPEAQIAAGLIMRNYATSCIDISDGLVQDLQHILTASQVGAEIQIAKIPLASDLADLEPMQALEFALAGGEDYQLVMTIPNALHQAFEENIPVPVTCIGKIVQGSQIELLDENNKLYPFHKTGYQHF